MNLVEMSLSDLHKAEKNIRIHSEQQLAEYRRSLKQFGQTKPFVVDENNTILIGNGLYDAMVGMGYTVGYVLIKVGMTENEKKKLMMSDNKIFSLGIDNLDTLNEFLEEMKDDLDIPGYDEEILRQMVSEADEVTEKISTYGTLDEDVIKSIQNQSQEKRDAMRPEPAAVGSIAPQSPAIPVNETMTGSMATPSAPSEARGVEQFEQPSDIRKFVICPKCGEKIWL